MTEKHMDRSTFFNLVAKNAPQENYKQSIKNVIKDSFNFISRYLSFLPPIDQDIARLYYVDGLSQDQIKKLFGVCQAAISRRIKYLFIRIKFLLRAPSLNPIQVREDLRTLFDDSMFEFAYFFYWELAQNRVKFFIETSQSGAANKLTKILAFLRILIEKEPDAQDPKGGEKKYLALIYYDYFQFIHQKSNVITYIYKKSDRHRSNSFFVGDPVI